MRKCPECGSVWYSANEGCAWPCDSCKAILPKELNQQPEVNTERSSGIEKFLLLSNKFVHMEK